MNTDSDFILKGILNGEKAFVGPEIVQFDITNRCNNNCLCCWNNSPLLKPLPQEKILDLKAELPFELITKVIDELNFLKTKRLFFAGGGEPFIHPHIIEILRHAREKGFGIHINTNFTLIDRKKAEALVRMRINLIHVSILAGSPDVYADVHPNKKAEVFSQIKSVLIYISSLKKSLKQHLHNPLPHINLYYVIFNRNYHDIDNMIKLAMDTKADSVEFAPVDVITGKTDSLLLNKEQIEYVAKRLHMWQDKIQEYNKNEPVKLQIVQCENFLKRINSPGALKGRYEAGTVLNQPCYAGWAFARILANGDVNPCLKAKVSVGNIYNSSFADIWNSEQQQLFRRRAFLLNPNDEYLIKNIGNDYDGSLGCLKSCDNLQINIDMHKKYKEVLMQYGRIKQDNKK